MITNIEMQFDGERGQYYLNLIQKYSSYTFESHDEEIEYLEKLKELLNEHEDIIEFELKMHMMLLLVGGINLKKVNLLLSQ